MIDFNAMFDEFNTAYMIKKPGNTVKLIKDELIEMLAEAEKTPEHAKECADIVYIAMQQLRAECVDLNEVYSRHNGLSLHEFPIIARCIVNNHWSINDIIRLALSVIDYMCFPMSYCWQEILTEVHRSNMSKTVPRNQADLELHLARKRYPSAYIVEGQQYCILKCADTNKIIKPSCYSAAKLRGIWV